MELLDFDRLTLSVNLEAWIYCMANVNSGILCMFLAHWNKRYAIGDFVIFHCLLSQIWALPFDMLYIGVTSLFKASRLWYLSGILKYSSSSCAVFSLLFRFSFWSVYVCTSNYALSVLNSFVLSFLIVVTRAIDNCISAITLQTNSVLLFDDDCSWVNLKKP